MEVAASTVKSTLELVTPDRAAVILAVPAATPVAKPVEDIVAVAGSIAGPGYLRSNVRS